MSWLKYLLVILFFVNGLNASGKTIENAKRTIKIGPAVIEFGVEGEDGQGPVKVVAGQSAFCYLTYGVTFIDGWAWSPPYLMLPYWQGCASCHDGEGVFIFKMNKNQQLSYVGYITGIYEDPQGNKTLNKPKIFYKGGIFFDANVDLEDKGIGAHADSPDISLALREVNEKFVVDFDRTWSLGEKNYKDNMEALRKSPPIMGEVDMEQRRPAIGLLSNAVLAAYCGKKEAVRELLAIAKNKYPGLYQSILDNLAKVSPGHISRHYEIEWCEPLKANRE